MSTASDDDELDDPVLRALAMAPPIALGAPPLPPDTIVGQTYRLHAPLGAGAMGVVYEATDLVLSRRVAIKVHEIGRSDRAARLWREARAMAQLSHPNVVTIHEVGVEGSRGYIAMELVHGTNARLWRGAGERSWQEILDVYRQAGAGLAAAHDVGIVHRDFKPDNVLIGDDKRVRVADFGLALPPQAPAEESTVAERIRDHVTRTGATMGTPAYMAPEQQRRERADARSDQFSFCVTLHEALHGSRPARGEGPDDFSPATRRRGGVPAWIDAVIERGLAPEPSARWPDMHALVAALDPVPRRRRRAVWTLLIGAVVGGGLLVRVGGWLATEEGALEPCADAGGAIDESWSPEHAEAMRLSFQRRSPALADTTLAIVVPALDDFTAGWRGAARDACEATHVRNEQSAARLDQRMDCLSRARNRLVAVVDLLLQADAMTMVRAEAVAQSLPDVAMCARSDAALAADPIPAEKRATHERLSATLDRIVADAAAGEPGRALQAIDALIPELEAEHLVREQGEAHRVRGMLLLAMGRRSEAIAEAETASALAMRFEDRDAMARAILELARATGRAAVGFEQGARWLATARVLAGDLEWSPRRLDALREAELEIAFFSEKYAEVERVAPGILDEVPADSSTRVQVLSLQATALERQARFTEALAKHDEALALVERLVGPDHPRTAMVLGNRVPSLSTLSRWDEALRSLERVLAIRVAVFGPDAPVVGEAHRSIADVEVASGNPTEALAQYGKALEIHRRAHDDVGTCLDLANLGKLEIDLGMVTEGARHLDEALVLGTRAFGANSPRIADILVNRASASLNQGESARGVSELERALAIMAVELPADDLRAGFARVGLGVAYVTIGRKDDAVATFDEGHRIVTAKLPPEHPHRVALAMARAELLGAAGREDAALEQSKEAATLADSLLPEGDPTRIAAWTQLAELQRGARRGRSGDSRP